MRRMATGADTAARIGLVSDAAEPHPVAKLPLVHDERPLRQIRGSPGHCVLTGSDTIPTGAAVKPCGDAGGRCYEPSRKYTRVYFSPARPPGGCRRSAVSVGHA